jgi:hypothetical protein
VIGWCKRGLAGVVLTGVVLAEVALPALAGESAVLRVSARVVARCTVELPAAVPRERMPVDPAEVVAQACAGIPPTPTITAQPLAPPPDAVTSRRSGERVLVTLTY